jgi:hypothetical protein
MRVLLQRQKMRTKMLQRKIRRGKCNENMDARTVSTDLENAVVVDAGENAATEPTAATRMMVRAFMAIDIPAAIIACNVTCVCSGDMVSSQ